MLIYSPVIQIYIHTLYILYKIVGSTPKCWEITAAFTNCRFAFFYRQAEMKKIYLYALKFRITIDCNISSWISVLKSNLLFHFQVFRYLRYFIFFFLTGECWISYPITLCHINISYRYYNKLLYCLILILWRQNACLVGRVNIKSFWLIFSM